VVQTQTLSKTASLLNLAACTSGVNFFLFFKWQVLLPVYFFFSCISTEHQGGVPHSLLAGRGTVRTCHLACMLAQADVGSRATLRLNETIRHYTPF